MSWIHGKDYYIDKIDGKEYCVGAQGERPQYDIDYCQRMKEMPKPTFNIFSQVTKEGNMDNLPTGTTDADIEEEMNGDRTDADVAVPEHDRLEELE